MNAYLLLPQKNVQINNIPPRLMWNIDANSWGSTTSGYCGETSILSAGLLYGQYVPMYLVRQVLLDYFNTLWGDNPASASSALIAMWSNYYGVNWTDSGAPQGDYPNSGNVPQDWFQKNGQYYCQLLPQIGSNSQEANSSFSPINAVLENLHLAYEHFAVAKQDTQNSFIPWMKQHVLNGYPVTIGVQDFLAGSNDTDFDHIVTVIGWGSNNHLGNTQYYPDDEIVFSDHGLVIGGQQPHGGSIPYYFRFVMETPLTIFNPNGSLPEGGTGGWLPDGGCPDPANPAWNFIMDLGDCRNLYYSATGQLTPCKADNPHSKYTCNTYQLAQSPSTMGSDGNAGFAITGLSDILPVGVQVRIDTDCYYQVPTITTEQARNGVAPQGQMMTHTITVTGLDAGLRYNLWLLTADDSNQILQIPTTGFNEYGANSKALSILIQNETSFTYTFQQAADIALFVRCVLTTDS